MRNLIFTALFALIFFSCKKDSPVTSAQHQSGSTLNTSYTFPFGIGHKWVYSISETLADSTNPMSYASTQIFEHVLDTIINGESTHKIQVTDSSSNGIRIAYKYYYQDSTGLYSNAELGQPGGIMLFKFRDLFSFNPGFKKNNSSPFQTDSVFVADTSLYILQTPIAINNSWYSHEFGSAAVHSVFRKWIVLNVSVNVPAGYFNCNKLQVFFDFNHDGLDDNGTRYQYFGNKGLIKYEQVTSTISSSGSHGILSISGILKSVNF